MRFVPLLALVALTACATKSDPVVKTVEVRVPVPTACAPVLDPAKPLPTNAVSPDADVFSLSKAFALDRSQLIVEGLNLRAALAGCAGPEAAAARLVSP